jgi:magnesium-transporting ATPase (P-type)
MAKEQTVAIDITQPPYRLSAEQVAQELETNLETGLTDAQAKQKLDKYGPNKLDGGEGVAVWEVLFKQVGFTIQYSALFHHFIRTGPMKLSIQAANTYICQLSGRKRHDSGPYSRNGLVLRCPRLG